MKRVKCPCCGYYTHYAKDYLYLFQFCDVCFWQFDVTHDEPDRVIGANKISLNEARENYKKYGICKPWHLGKGLNREPLPEELPENNIENEDEME